MSGGPPRGRSNREWVENLRSAGSPQAAALADLRDRILSGLPHAVGADFAGGPTEFAAFAEDVAQETLLRVLQHLDSFADRSQFTTWVQKIAVNVAWTELRHRRWKDVSLDALLRDAGDSPLPPGADNPARASEQAEMMGLIGRLVVEELTARQRQALLAHMVHGMPLEEVARRMQTNRNALYKLLHDARVKLKRCLEREGLSPEDLLTTFDAG